MREIKFRAWHKGLKQMWWHEWMGDLDEFFGRINSDSDAFDIMQFTGLKDKNGKEIFEGDILKGNQGNFEVVFADATFLIKYPTGQAVQPLWVFLKSCGKREVIGNIYETPELLK
jgi:hypothetical protein